MIPIVQGLGGLNTCNEPFYKKKLNLQCILNMHLQKNIIHKLPSQIRVPENI